MLERISWSTYWTVLISGVAIYYLAVFILYFKKGFFSKRKVKIISTPSDNPESPLNSQPNLFGYANQVTEKPSSQSSSPLPVDEKILMPFVHDLIQELKEFISDIAIRSYIKEEIIMGIQVIIKNYKKLEGSPYQKSINDYIKSEVEDCCSIHFSEDDIQKVWLG